MEDLQLFILVVQSLLTVIAGLGIFIIKSILKRIETVEADMKTMKDNYLNRFQQVIANQTDTKETLIKVQADAKIELIEAIDQLRIDIVSSKVYRAKKR